jgi:hypothetical protein
LSVTHTVTGFSIARDHIRTNALHTFGCPARSWFNAENCMCAGVVCTVIPVLLSTGQTIGYVEVTNSGEKQTTTAYYRRYFDKCVSLGEHDSIEKAAHVIHQHDPRRPRRRRLASPLRRLQHDHQIR